MLQCQSYNGEIPRYLTSNSSQVTMDMLKPVFSKTLRLGSNLQTLNIMTLGSGLLPQLEEGIRLQRNRPGTLSITLFSRSMESRGRILVQANVRGDDCSSAEEDNFGDNTDRDNRTDFHSSLSASITFLQWNCDYIYAPLTAFTTSLLDLATIHNPSALQAFTLDISHLSPKILSLVQDVLHRSSLERLSVVSRKVQTAWRDRICQVLAATQCSPLKSITFIGNSVDEWLQLWEASAPYQTTDFPPFGLCLQRLETIRSGTGAQQKLSHLSALLRHRAIYSGSLTELHLENVYMEEKRDWDLIAGASD